MICHDEANEYLHLTLNEDGSWKIDWNIANWRIEFANLYFNESISHTTIRLIAWKGNLQTNGNKAYFVDIIAKGSKGSIVITESIPFTNARAEVGARIKESFFPFFHTYDIPIKKSINSDSAYKWTLFELVDKQEFEAYTSTYTYYSMTGGVRAGKTNS
ncbi:hypothetical protein [Sutcliffiella rhizosphaerae]|uniref:Uncharacterized protein n=1 Tax=Sutcliffiella rhizosphaerae TaxID=2880967 RepID=A0ABN8A3T0_9BACI|nr:hypothetical protein [Sutcliffiella rhizosphaerae]CAG9619309.1 hypothetical protein BACCIP111883_00076 [Sutcliffiella rhizosphaerae]